MVRRVRNNNYTHIINVHRYASTGFITAFSGADHKIGFRKNPWSFTYSVKVNHTLSEGMHEIDRNQRLIAHLTDVERMVPRLYPTPQDLSSILKFQSGNYICIAPASVWFTKQLPATKWVEFIIRVEHQVDTIYLLGAPGDKSIGDTIMTHAACEKVINLSGSLSFLQSAALMKGAKMNFVNDSAPMHLASAVNAPVTAVYCSTIPAFGFGPLSDQSHIVEVSGLPCRPCGSHGHKACPLSHFKCAHDISIHSLQNCLAK